MCILFRFFFLGWLLFDILLMSGTLVLMLFINNSLVVCFGGENKRFIVMGVGCCCFFWSSSTAKSLSLCVLRLLIKLMTITMLPGLYLDGLAKNCGRNNGPNSTIKTMKWRCNNTRKKEV